MSLSSSKQFSKVVSMFPVPFSITVAVTLVLPEILKENERHYFAEAIFEKATMVFLSSCKREKK